MQVKQISGNEIYLLIKYIKSVLWRVAKRLSYAEEARRLKVNFLEPSGPLQAFNGTALSFFFLKFIQTCTLDALLHRVTYTRCSIDTINSPDDG